MKIQLIGNPEAIVPGQTLEDVLRRWILKEDWRRLEFYSAFATESAANAIVSIFQDYVDSVHQDDRHKRSVGFIIGSYLHVTEPKAIRVLVEFGSKAKEAGIRWEVYRPTNLYFHVKCYTIRRQGSGCILVGSPNLTEPGLACEGEFGILIEECSFELLDSISLHLGGGQPWELHIDNYEKEWQKHKFQPPDFDLPKQHQLTKSHRGSEPEMPRIIKTAPTIGPLEEISEKKIRQIRELYERLREKFPSLAYGRYILNPNYPQAECERDYLEGSWFDVQVTGDEEWKEGSCRELRQVGKVAALNENDSVIFINRGRRGKRTWIKYTVTKEVIEKVKELNGRLWCENDKPSPDVLEQFRKWLMKKKPTR